jgi:hypothetical protein
MSSNDSVRPFRIHIPEESLEDGLRSWLEQKIAEEL